MKVDIPEMIVILKVLIYFLLDLNISKIYFIEYTNKTKQTPLPLYAIYDRENCVGAET